MEISLPVLPILSLSGLFFGTRFVIYSWILVGENQVLYACPFIYYYYHRASLAPLRVMRTQSVRIHQTSVGKHYTSRVQLRAHGIKYDYTSNISPSTVRIVRLAIVR